MGMCWLCQLGGKVGGAVACRPSSCFKLVGLEGEGGATRFVGQVDGKEQKRVFPLRCDFPGSGCLRRVRGEVEQESGGESKEGRALKKKNSEEEERIAMPVNGHRREHPRFIGYYMF